MEPSSSPPPTPPSPPNQEDDFLHSSSDEEQAQSRVRRESVHYASIGEFLASLRSKAQDKAICLEDYLGAIRCPDQDANGDGNPVKDKARPEQAKD